MKRLSLLLFIALLAGSALASIFTPWGMWQVSSAGPEPEPPFSLPESTLYYAFSNSTPVDGIVTDYSLLGADGTNFGSAWNSATGTIAAYHTFAGDNDYIRSTNGTTFLSELNEVSWSFWAKPASLAASDHFMGSRGTKVQQIYMSAGDSTVFRVDLDLTNSSGGAVGVGAGTTANTVETDVWQKYDVVFSCSNVAADSFIATYKNGVMVDKVANLGIAANRFLSVDDYWYFGDRDNVNSPYDGALANIRILTTNMHDEVSDAFWFDAANFGWSPAFTNDRSLWQDSIAAYTFEYDYPADTGHSAAYHGSSPQALQTPAFVVASGAGSYLFSGAQANGNDFVYVADDDVFSVDAGATDKPITVSCWLRPASYYANAYIVMKGANTPLAREWGIISGSGGTKAGFWLFGTDGGSSARYNLGTALDVLSTNYWTHVAYTYDGNGPSSTALKMYTNGVEVTSVRGGSYATTTYAAGAGANTAYGLCIGGGYDNNNTDADYGFDGYIDDVMVFSNELSSAEIQTIYDATKETH